VRDVLMRVGECARHSTVLFMVYFDVLLDVLNAAFSLFYVLFKSSVGMRIGNADVPFERRIVVTG
jgi:hypothetical protein